MLAILNLGSFFLPEAKAPLLNGEGLFIRQVTSAGDHEVTLRS